MLIVIQYSEILMFDYIRARNVESCNGMDSPLLGRSSGVSDGQITWSLEEICSIRNSLSKKNPVNCDGKKTNQRRQTWWYEEIKNTAPWVSSLGTDAFGKLLQHINIPGNTTQARWADSEGRSVEGGRALQDKCDCNLTHIFLKLSPVPCFIFMTGF